MITPENFYGLVMKIKEILSSQEERLQTTIIIFGTPMICKKNYLYSNNFKCKM